ncbi:sulfatase-like hydrolase/transferase [Capnocytophaga sp.]|uniref:sulfatase-like hydrolase/transferase n=1 Tax=Capnocytophaga sp. TaxID=44737 RepID=UPI0026DCD025|nr:sulfatase-like hydrolase/transferase [Capnocytophaga sp.]MDO5104268.1 sulfatase-like hydrolase/transferase [Capnocytophaga sp.]
MKAPFISIFILLLLNCASSSQKNTSQRNFPNVILIYADDLGYGDVSCYGGTIQTPHIDRLSEHGIKHLNAYLAAATCTPSRYTLLTGEYAWRKQGRGVINADAQALIPAGKQTVASVFKQVGYTTAVIGKWHLGLGDENGINWNGEIANTPEDVGFDESFIIPATADRVPCVYVQNRKVVNLNPADTIHINYQNPVGNSPTGRQNPELLKLPYSHGHDMTIINGISRIGYQSGGTDALWKDEDIADDLVREAKKFITKQKNHPFFLFLATNNIHVPRMPHPRFQGTTTQGLRGDAIVELDAMVGEISKILDSLRLSERTIVIFSSDNGAVLDDGYADNAVELTGKHDPFGKLRGGKYSAYEAGTRIPFIVSWKGKLKKQDSKTLISQTDFISSMASMLNTHYDKHQAIDSEDQWLAWTGKKQQGRTHIIQEAIRNTLSIVKGNYKYIEPSQSTMKTAWETGIETGFSPKPQLYNLKNDPKEQNNITTTLPSITKELKEELEKVKNNKK